MIASTTDELATIFRDDVDDPLEGTVDVPDLNCLWKETTVYRYMTEALDKVAKATDTLYRTYRLPVQAGVQAVALPQSVLDIREARLASNGRNLLPENINDTGSRRYDDYGMSGIGSNQFFTATGVPGTYVRDYQARALLLSPISAINDTVIIQATATIGMRVTACMPLPFQDTEDLSLVLMWMKHLAYLKQDADVTDMTASKDWKKMFEDAAEERAVNLRKYRRTAATVKYQDV